MKRLLVVSCLTAFCLVLSASGAAGQEARANNRVGLWGGFGVGAGLLGCLESGCSHDEWGFSGNAKLGGTLTPSLRLAGGTNGYFKTINGTDFTFGVVSLQMLVYPSESDFFLVGGAGLAYARASESGFSNSETGAGFVVGLGYDIPLGRSGNLALSPFANWVITTIEPTMDFVQFGLGLTFN